MSKKLRPARDLNSKHSINNLSINDAIDIATKHRMEITFDTPMSAILTFARDILRKKKKPTVSGFKNLQEVFNSVYSQTTKLN